MKYLLVLWIAFLGLSTFANSVPQEYRCNGQQVHSDRSGETIFLHTNFREKVLEVIFSLKNERPDSAYSKRYGIVAYTVKSPTSISAMMDHRSVDGPLIELNLRISAETEKEPNNDLIYPSRLTIVTTINNRRLHRETKLTKEYDLACKPL